MMRSGGLILSAMIAFAGGSRAAAQTGASVQGAAVQTAAASASGAAMPAGLMEAEWKFLKAGGENKNEEVVAAVLPEIEGWLKLYPDSEYASEAQFLKARIHLRLGDYKSAIVDLLKHLQEYPDAASGASARKLFTETAVKKLNDKNAKVLIEIGKVSEASTDKAARLADTFGKLAARDGEEFYEPLVSEFSSFFSRFLSYSGRDVLQLELGDLHAKKGNYLAAKLAYEKVINIYPDSRFLVKAKKALGDVLANNLKEYDAAIVVYQDVAAAYPGTDEAWAAYVQLAKLSERQEKYELAVEIHEKIIALYPGKDAAYDSYNAEARILREELSKFPEAVAVLGRLADAYKGEKAVEALYLAAKIAKKDMKDLAAEVKIYDRIAGEYQQGSQAPKALFAAAEAYENAKDFDNAKKYYEKVSDQYPQDSLSAKAQKRMNAIISK
jgi:TolA-binding protein